MTDAVLNNLTLNTLKHIFPKFPVLCSIFQQKRLISGHMKSDKRYGKTSLLHFHQTIPLHYFRVDISFILFRIVKERTRVIVYPATDLNIFMKYKHPIESLNLIRSQITNSKMRSRRFHLPYLLENIFVVGQSARRHFVAESRAHIWPKYICKFQQLRNNLVFPGSTPHKILI